VDRNTLLAFFLISIVLIFTPKYMELFAPPQPPPEQKEFKNEKGDDNPYSTKVEQNGTTPDFTKPEPVNKVKKEFLTEIETDLYNAVVSSEFGGTIKSFELKNYMLPDSQNVNLINPTTPNNLFFEATDLDGQKIYLQGGWVLEKETTFSRNEQQTLTYKKEVFINRYVYKTLVFNQGSYVIDIETDFSSIKNDVYNDISFGWGGGLSSTEDNKEDDFLYFKSYLYQGEELEELKVSEGEAENNLFNGVADWVATRTKYFTAAIIPFSPQLTRGASLFGSAKPDEVYGASLLFSPKTEHKFRLYLGPLEYDRIKDLGVNLESIMDFGWAFIRPISKGVLYSLKKMHEYIPNYGYVLIVFSFLVKLLVYPLTKKSYQSTAAMQKIQPEINALREKYKSNPQKLNQAQIDLYKEKGVNPLGGCFPMLLQMPLLFALFVVFRTTIELRAEPFIFWIKDLSSPDTIFYLPFKIPIYGDHVAILPIIMVFSMFIQQRMMTVSSGGAQQAQQKMMQYFMTGFFFLLFNGFPSGLNLYYTLFNILTIAQQKLIPTDK